MAAWTDTITDPIKWNEDTVCDPVECDELFPDSNDNFQFRKLFQSCTGRGKGVSPFESEIIPDSEFPNGLSQTNDAEDPHSCKDLPKHINERTVNEPDNAPVSPRNSVLSATQCRSLESQQQLTDGNEKIAPPNNSKIPLWKRINFPMSKEELHVNDYVATAWGYVSLGLSLMLSGMTTAFEFAVTWVPPLLNSLMKSLRRVECVDAALPTSTEWSVVLAGIWCQVKLILQKTLSVTQFLVFLLWSIIKNSVGFMLISLLWAFYILLSIVSNIFMSRTLQSVARLVKNPLTNDKRGISPKALSTISSGALVFYQIPKILVTIVRLPMLFILSLPTDENILKNAAVILRQEIAKGLGSVQQFALFIRVILIDIHEFVTMLLFLMWMFAEISLNLCSYLMLVSQTFQLILWISRVFSQSVLQLNTFLSLAQKKRRTVS